MTAEKVLTYETIWRARDNRSSPGNPVAITLTCGVWDCLHVGHVEHLEWCARWAKGPLYDERVVVCVGSDATVRMLKGPGRPIVPEQDRARLVAALECVDAVVISEEHGRMNFTRLMELLRPDRLVVAADDPVRDAKMALCGRMGVEMVIDDTRPEAGPSTTRIVSQVLEGAR